jgi:hypothetical protein
VLTPNRQQLRLPPDKLSLSIDTVLFHVRSIYEKLNSKSEGVARRNPPVKTPTEPTCSGGDGHSPLPYSESV